MKGMKERKIMKKRKILYLFPLAALVLSGCTLQEGWDIVKDFSVSKVYEPVRDWILGLMGKEVPKKDDKKDDQGGGGRQDGGEEEQPSKYGTQAKPLSVSEAITLISNEDPTNEVIYVTGTIISNGAWNTQYEQVDITIGEGEQSLKVFRATVLPEGFKASEITANSLKGMTLVASGIGMTFGSTYEVAADAENGILCTVLSFAGEPDEQGQVDNYGTAEHPLTVSEAIEVIKIQDPTQQPIYVKGEVNGNGDWYSAKSNIDIYLTDGVNTIQMFRANKFPEGMDLSSVKKNDLIGNTVVGKGIGTYYVDGKKYELDQGCEVISMTEPVIELESVEITSGDSVVSGYTLNLEAKVLPDKASQEVEWSVVSGFANGSIEGNVLTGLEPGIVIVRATAKGTEIYDEKEITVVEATKTYVESIVADPAEITMTMGDNPVQLAATVTPQAVDEEISWAVSPEGVVELDDNHGVHAVAPGKATIRIEGAESHVGVDVPVTVNKKVTPIADVYAAAMSGDTTTEFTFKGVVTAMQGNSFYLQENGSGILVYNYKIEGNAVGKLVQLSAKVTVYKGLVETNGSCSDGTILGDGQLPTPLEVTGLADIGDANILANVHNAEFVSKDAEWSGSKASLAVFKIGNDNITVKFDKYGFDADKGALLNNAQAGAKFNLLNIVTAINTDQEQPKQLGFAGTSTIEGIFDAPESVAITSKDEIAIGETLTLAATVSPATASQEVEWAVTSGADKATLENGKLTGVAAGEVVLKATAKGYENIFATQTLTVKDESAPTPVHAGTQADPYSVSDAKLLFDGLADGENTAECYVTGTIVADPAPAISSGRANCYISDGASTQDLYCYSVNNIGGANTLKLSDIPYGSVIVAKGVIKNYQGTFELCWIKNQISCEFISIEKPALASVVVSGTASQTEYAVGAEYNHNGLVATANFASGAAVDVSSEATWNINPTTASANDSSITVTATFGGVTSAAVNVSVTVVADAPTELTATIAYTGSTTSNMDGSNQAAALGCSDTHISVVGAKINGGQNNVGLNKDGTFRLYKNSTCSLTISITGGTITKLDIKIGGTYGTLQLNGATVEGAGANKTVSPSVNGTSAVLTNSHSSTQVYISQIVIHYTLD